MSDKTIDDDTLRAMLAARTPGEWAPYCDEGPIRYRYLAPDGDGWTYSVCVGGHGDDHTCVLTATGPDVATAHANAAMAAVAPALAAEVLRLRAERDELRARPTYEARTTPPTLAERKVHQEAGGAWLVCRLDSDGKLHSDVLIGWHGWRWEGCIFMALDAERRLCAWPVGGEL